MKICSKHRARSAGATNVAMAIAFSTLTLASSMAPAQNSNLQSFNSEATEYYTIEEGSTRITANPVLQNLSPLSAFTIPELRAYARSVAFNLLRWTLHPEKPKQPRIKYNRKLHFGRWINDPTDETCFNTRAKVLIRDSEQPVSFKDHNRCLVEKGDWQDPYAGSQIKQSRDIQIDHMVPLKNAYLSGAWEWKFKTRCAYSNFMGNKFHLISASGHENMSKGDKGPDQYMPPNKAYRCEYLENWLKIKLIWKLKMTSQEVEAIRQGIEEDHCDSRKFSLSVAELKRQRKLINEANDLCPGRENPHSY